MNTNNTVDTAQDYDVSRYDRPSVTVDVVAFTVRNNKLYVLLVRRGVWPFEGAWALPGGFVRMDEELQDAAHRELAEETGVTGTQYLEQLYTFGNIGRDPRTRVISVAYYALLPNKESGLPEIEEPRGGTDAAEAKWWPLEQLPTLAFDHGKILQTALARLQAKLGYTTVAYALLTPEFTLTDLQMVYEIILGKSLDKRNFRKKMLATGILEGLEQQRRGGAHRPAQLFRFVQKEPVFF